MYRIKLKKHSGNVFDEIIDIENEDEAHCIYCEYMGKPYFYGKLVKVIDGKEKNIASFCNSEFATP